MGKTQGRAMAREDVRGGVMGGMIDIGPRRRRERGAGVLEYVGSIVMAALVVTMIFAAIPSTDNSSLAKSAYCWGLKQAGFGGTCDVPVTPLPPNDYKPVDCKVSEESEQAGYEASIGFITWGQDWGWITQTMSDGRVRLTAVDKASLGAIAEAGWDIGGSKGARAKISIGGGLTVSSGDTWEFKDKAEMEKFREEIEQARIEEMQLSGEGGAGIAIWYWLSGKEWADPPDPTITYATIGYTDAVKGGLGVQFPTGKNNADGKPLFIDPSTGVELKLNLVPEGSIMVAHNSKKGTTAYTYNLSWGGGASGSVVGKNASWEGKTAGAYTVTRNDKGEIVSMAFTTTHETVTSAGLNGKTAIRPTTLSNSAKDTSGILSISTSTTTIDFTTPAERETAQKWLDNYSSGTTENLMWGANYSPTQKPPPGSDPFYELLYQKGKTLNTDYEGIKNVEEYGAEIALGLKFGMKIKMEDSDYDVVKAEYLAGPQADGTRSMTPYAECTS